MDGHFSESNIESFKDGIRNHLGAEIRLGSSCCLNVNFGHLHPWTTDTWTIPLCPAGADPVVVGLVLGTFPSCSDTFLYLLSSSSPCSFSAFNIPCQPPPSSPSLESDSKLPEPVSPDCNSWDPQSVLHLHSFWVWPDRQPKTSENLFQLPSPTSYVRKQSSNVNFLNPWKQVWFDPCKREVSSDVSRRKSDRWKREQRLNYYDMKPDSP